MSERMWRHEMVDPLLYTCPILVEFLWSLIYCIRNLSISLFSCAKTEFGCCWFVVQNWMFPPQNGNPLFRFEELNSKINLSLRIEPNERSVLIIYSDSGIVCLFISSLVPLRPLVGLRPPSNVFIHSLSTRSVQNTTPEYVLRLCGCSLTLTLTTSIGIW